MFAKFLAANVHLIGKEIVRQHGIYWPFFDGRGPADPVAAHQP
jgi:methionyl-tRNA synthetase